MPTISEAAIQVKVDPPHHAFGVSTEQSLAMLSNGRSFEVALFAEMDLLLQIVVVENFLSFGFHLCAWFLIVF